LLNPAGQERRAATRAARRYPFIVCPRGARRYGVPFEGPPTHPFNPLPALRMTLAVDPDFRWTWVRRVLNACWAEGKDISNPELLVTLTKELSLDGKELWDQSQSPAVKEALKQNTEEAIQKGVFGVPTFSVDGELFWGADRLELLKSFLKGELPATEERVEELLKRPSSANRFTK